MLTPDAPPSTLDSNVNGAGHWMLGGVVSRTVTLKLARAALPRESVAAHCTVVKPSGKIVPEAGEQVTGSAPSTASVAVGEFQVTMAPLGPVASTVIEEADCENQVSS